MGRPHRAAVGGIVYHVLNRANGRACIFDDAGDYAAFEKVLEEAAARFGTRLLAYCLMPNHWHLVLWPGKDGELSRFTSWLSLTHTQRWHAHRHTAGTGHVYQGRFKSFPVQTNAHFLTACRYVERNAVRANLVERAEDWRWSSVWRRERGTAQQQQILAEWPVPRQEPPRRRGPSMRSFGSSTRYSWTWNQTLPPWATLRATTMASPANAGCS